MQDTPGAVLIAEIGSVNTRLTLIDLVDEEFRLISQAEVLSSFEAPQDTAMAAVLVAAEQIAEATGRVLVRGGQLLMPQNNERDGVDGFVAVTSATGLLSLVITAVASDVSAHSALRAVRCMYSSVLQVVTLDDAAKQPLANNDRSWIERQVQTLVDLNPDAVLIAGGLEGGAEDAIKRLARIVALTAQRPKVDASGQARNDIMTRPVIYAGNTGAREQVLEALNGRSEPKIVDNLRPSLEYEHLEPVRSELTDLYAERMLPRLPGMATLRRLSRVPVTTVCATQGLMTRFLAERYNRQVLMLDIGSANSAAYLCSEGRYSPAVLGNCGVGYGISTILSERGVVAIARWLPFAIDEQTLTHWLLNKLVRPQLLPASRKDVWIEYAVAREALSLVLDALRDERPEPVYDMVVLAGSVFAHAPHPAWALLALLDVLQPTGGSGTTALLDVYVDSLGLLAASGAVATLNPDAAVTLCERDLLRSTPLATCLTALGNGRMGDVALEVELVPTRGKTQHVSVQHGQIVRLRLDQGNTAQLTLRPAPGVRIGGNAPGVEVSSDVAAISGSALGVVIDARGRPLNLPADDSQRWTRLWDGLVTLGGARGTNPFEAERNVAPPEPASPLPAAPTAEILVPAPATPEPAAEVAAEEAVSIQPSKRISLDELRQQEAPTPAVATPPAEPAAAAPANLENDLAQLRQTVEVPKKRGLFGRKK